MRSPSAVWPLLALLALPAAPLPAADGAADAGGGARTLNGLYTSGFQSGPQRLRAEFKPRDDGDWDVAFRFRWSGAERVYTGIARGSLSGGVLQGRVQDEGRARTFIFRCEFDRKNRCKGRHAEIVPTGEHETGTITLKE